MTFIKIKQSIIYSDNKHTESIHFVSIKLDYIKLIFFSTTESKHYQITYNNCLINCFCILNHRVISINS